MLLIAISAEHVCNGFYHRHYFTPPTVSWNLLGMTDSYLIIHMCNRLIRSQSNIRHHRHWPRKVLLLGRSLLLLLALDDLLHYLSFFHQECTENAEDKVRFVKI